MANSTTRSSSLDSSLSNRKEFSRDELLCLQYERYLIQVSESGLPLWVVSLYGFPLSVLKEEEQPPDPDKFPWPCFGEQCNDCPCNEDTHCSFNPDHWDAEDDCDDDYWDDDYPDDEED